MKRADIHEIFHPHSIAVVGASDDITRGATRFLKALMMGGYKGELYAVNPHSKTALGMKSYPSLKDIPGNVNHAVIGVPAHLTPSVLEDAVEKGLRSVHLFTSGFAETETEEGIDLQRRIDRIAGGKVRIIGPNCLGIYNPKMNIVFDQHQSTIPGGFGFISQSGGMSIVFSEMARDEQNYCSKLVSIGNASDLKMTDFLEYLSGDHDTQAIGIYLEGLRNDEGGKFLEIIRETTRIKPVVMWKAGQTDAGARAASSHTGSVAGGYDMWRIMARQLGVVMVDSIEEMHDFLKILRMLDRFPKTNRCCLVTQGGGNCVGFSDICAKEGVGLPELQSTTQEGLLDFIPPMGTIRRNPIDLSASGFAQDVVKKAIELASNDRNIDFIMYILDIGFVIKRANRFGKRLREFLVDQVDSLVAAGKEISIPLICCTPAFLQDRSVAELRQDLKRALQKNNIPIFPSVERASKAIMKYFEYHCFKNGAGS